MKLTEDNFKDAVEGVEVSIMGMSPNVAAKAIAAALMRSYGKGVATKIVLLINKLMKIR
tara:strand:+ start:976 stop:1152 length:177 start_codon:yes stop_codon:yes gene_type:complete